MTGMMETLLCEVYYIVELTFHRLSPFSAKNDFSGTHTWMHESDVRCRDSDFTVA